MPSQLPGSTPAQPPIPVTVDSRRFLLIPGWIWDAIFKIVQLGVVAYFGNSAVNSIQNNGAEQVKHAEAFVAKQEETKQAVVENTAAKQAGPTVLIESKNTTIQSDDKPTAVKPEPDGL